MQFRKQGSEVGILGSGAALRLKEVEDHVLADDEAAFAKTVAKRHQRTRLRRKSSTKPADPIHLPRLLRLARERCGEDPSNKRADEPSPVNHWTISKSPIVSTTASPIRRMGTSVGWLAGV